MWPEWKRKAKAAVVEEGMGAGGTSGVILVFSFLVQIGVTWGCSVFVKIQICSYDMFFSICISQ